MAVTRVAAGAAASAASGNVTPAMFAGVAVDDIIVVVVTSGDNVACTFPVGYTIKAALNNGTTLRTTIAWKRAVGSDAAPLVTHAAGDSIDARCIGYRGAAGAGGVSDPFDAAVTSANASSLTVTVPAITPTVAGSMLLALISNGGNPANPQDSTAVTGTNPTFTKVWTPADQNGGGVNEADQVLDDGIKSDTTSSGARTSTLNVIATPNTAIVLALQPAGAGVTPAYIPRAMPGGV